MGGARQKKQTASIKQSGNRTANPKTTAARPMPSLWLAPTSRARRGHNENFWGDISNAGASAHSNGNANTATFNNNNDLNVNSV